MRGSPGFSGELGNYCDTSLCCTTVYYWIMGVVTSTCKAMSCALGIVGKSRIVLKDDQLMAIKHVYTARMCLYGYRQIRQVPGTHVWVFPFVFIPHIHFGKAEATYCNCIPYRIFLRAVICKFSIRISMNYMEDIAELLAHAQTVDTRSTSPIFVERLGTGLDIFKLITMWTCTYYICIIVVLLTISGWSC